MVSVTASEQPLIEAAGVTKRFGHVTALDDVSTSVTSPALGLLGANGAGKSTFMKAMLGLVTPESGQVRVLGMDAAHQAREIRRLLGYMPENMCLPMGMTARDFIVHMGELRGLPRRVAVLRASEVLFQVGLEEERSRLIRTFSIGMKQRTNLAQAIVHSPSLVILDEPTNGLDPAGREEMLALIADLPARRGVSVILSSHLLPDVERVCDEVMVLAAGKLEFTGTLSALRGDADDRFAVRVKDGLDKLAEALAAAGIDAQGDGEELSLLLPGGDTTAVFAAARAAGVQIRHLAPRRRSLEAAFLSRVRGP